MSIYRQYEDPYELEQKLKILQAQASFNPEDEDLAQEIAELKERILSQCFLIAKNFIKTQNKKRI